MPAEKEALRVVANGIPMIPPRAGVGRYVRSSSEALRRIEPGIRTGFFYGRRIGGLEEADGIRRAGRWAGRLPCPGALFARWAADRIRGHFFRRVARKGRFDLYHETNYAPFPFDGPVLVSVYDLSVFRVPGTHPADRVRWMSRRIRAVAASGARFLTISETVRREMGEGLSIPADRIDVVPPACEPVFLAPLPADLPARRSALGLPPAYLLSVGTVEPRKNLDTLLRSIRILRDRGAPPPPLIVAGPRGWKSERTFRLLGDLRLGEAVRFAGFLPDPDLAAAYAGASLFLGASLYEGYGIPPMEALAAGTPVLLSDIPAHREAYAPCAGFAPALEPGAWADAIAAHLRDPAALAARAAAGREIAEGRTWEKAAALLAESYRRTARG